MPITGATLSLGGTCSVTGGTSKTFTDVGETIKNGKKVSDLTVTDSRVRPSITCINRPATLNSLGKYISKDKRTVKLVWPKLLADGTIVFNVRELRIEDHPETTDVEKANADSYMAQVLFDPDFNGFVRNGSTS